MSSTESDKNRWLIAVSAMAIHLSIGSVYAYSVYQLPLQETLGWSIADVNLGFTVAIFTLGLASASLGRYPEKYGPRIAGLAAALLFGGGTVLAGVSVQLSSYVGVLLTFGVVAGIGLGVGYVTPISTLVSWFPDRRFLATGLAVMGFGAGALVTGPGAFSYVVAGFSRRLLGRLVAAKDDQVGPRELPAVLLFDRIEQSAGLVEVDVVGPATLRREALQGAGRAGATVEGAIRSGAVSGHPNSGP